MNVSVGWIFFFTVCKSIRLLCSTRNPNRTNTHLNFRPSESSSAAKAEGKQHSSCLSVKHGDGQRACQMQLSTNRPSINVRWKDEASPDFSRMAMTPRIVFLICVLPWTAFGFSSKCFPTKSHCIGRQSDILRRYSKDDETTTRTGTASSFSKEIIHSLDLVPLMENIASHAATRRGYTALMSLVKKEQGDAKANIPLRIGSSESTSRRRAMILTEMGSMPLSRTQQIMIKTKKKSPLVEIAQSLKQVQHGYELVEQASLLLSGIDNGGGDDRSYPPIYGVDSSPWDVNKTPESDDDEWLFLPPHQYTCEHILQAEQVIHMLFKVRGWSQNSDVQFRAPKLARLASNIVEEMDELSVVYHEIEGAVQIVRVRSIMDIQGKSTYSVRLKEDRFPVLELLRERENELLKRGGKEYDEDVVAIQKEIDSTTKQIVSGLAQRVLSVANIIDHGLDVVSELDIIMAKAAYGASLSGVFPLVQDDGEIQVENFLHPVLARTMDQETVVPVDLRLPSQSGEQALIISGPNGGGKSMSMKSFGMVSILTKLGIPIPVTSASKRPRIDFFDEILANIGDHQNVLDGESTWTSILNACATIIEKFDSHERKNYLVLLDEFGSAGTDPEACGAVAQAILEEMMSKPCKIVLTTHSPRLKALSFEHSTIGCAAVLLDEGASSLFKLPSFKLEYGIIGESYALGAASRTRPSLPNSVISRATELMSANDGETGEKRTHRSYIQALTSSMEEQLERTKSAAGSAEEFLDDVTKCRHAMVSLAASYDSHLERLLDKLDDTFQKLKIEGKSELELVGETISEVKVVRKKVISQQERLAQQGLRVLPIDYPLTPGESVVILSNGQWQGMTAKVVPDRSSNDTPLGKNEVLVRPSSSLHAWDDVMLTNLDPMTERPLIFQRHELAIWEYDGMLDDSYKSNPATSVSDSKRKVDSLLATINSVSTKQKNSTAKKGRFVSSRDRKAANKGNKKRK